MTTLFPECELFPLTLYIDVFLLVILVHDAIWK